MVQARHFGKRLQWHRAGRNIYFSSPSALLPLLERSWGEEGGGDVASSCQPERRPGAPLPSSLPSLSSRSSLGFLEAGAFRTLERSAQLEVAISNYPPISPDCKMCFCVGCLLGRVLVWWVASHCFFRRPGRGTSRYLGLSPNKLKYFPWSYPGVNQYASPGIYSFIHLLVYSFT